MDQPATLKSPAPTTLPGVVDCDVHPLFKDGFGSLYPYMPEAWRERFKRKRVSQAISNLTLRFTHPNGTVVRDDARPDTGGPGGSDPSAVRGACRCR